jgi:hypothetical protein
MIQIEGLYLGAGEASGSFGSSVSPPVAPALQKKKNNTISKIFGRTSPAQGGFPKPARKVDTKAIIHNSRHKGPHIHKFDNHHILEVTFQKDQKL